MSIGRTFYTCCLEITDDFVSNKLDPVWIILVKLGCSKQELDLSFEVRL